MGVALELTLVKVFFQIVGEQGPTFGYLGRLDSGHIVHFIFLCNKWLYPEIIIFCLYSNSTEGGDLDLIDFQLQLLTHRQIYCTYIIILLWSVTGHILDRVAGCAFSGRPLARGDWKC